MQWTIMWDMVNFPEPEEKRANFTSDQKSMQYVHIILFFLILNGFFLGKQ